MLLGRDNVVSGERRQVQMDGPHASALCRPLGATALQATGNKRSFDMMHVWLIILANICTALVHHPRVAMDVPRPRGQGPAGDGR